MRQVNAICLTRSADRPERGNRSESVNVIRKEFEYRGNQKGPRGGMWFNECTEITSDQWSEKRTGTQTEIT